LAAKLHNEQKRKEDDLPYVSHPFSVAWILNSYNASENEIIAGLLHDVLEDVEKEMYTAEQMKDDFGAEILKIVQEVSENKDASITKEEEIRTWKNRKEKYLEHLKVASREAMMVCAADKIHNLKSLSLSLTAQGENTWNHFNAGKLEIAWYQKGIVEILEQRLDSPIVSELKNLTNTIF